MHEDVEFPEHVGRRRLQLIMQEDVEFPEHVGCMLCGERLYVMRRIMLCGDLMHEDVEFPEHVGTCGEDLFCGIMQEDVEFVRTRRRSFRIPKFSLQLRIAEPVKDMVRRYLFPYSPAAHLRTPPNTWCAVIFSHTLQLRISEPAKDMVRRFLRKDAKDRISLKDSLQHEWIVTHCGNVAKEATGTASSMGRTSSC